MIIKRGVKWGYTYFWKHPYIPTIYIHPSIFRCERSCSFQGGMIRNFYHHCPNFATTTKLPLPSRERVHLPKRLAHFESMIFRTSPGGIWTRSPEPWGRFKRPQVTAGSPLHGPMCNGTSWAHCWRSEWFHGKFPKIEPWSLGSKPRKYTKLM